MKIPLYLTSNNSYLHKSGDYLIIDKNGQKVPQPTSAISYIVLWGNSQISNQVLNYLADKGIIIFRFSYGGRYNGMFLPPESNIGKSRLQQYETYFDNERRLHLCKNIITTAAKNKITVLKRYYYKNKTSGIKDNIGFIRENIKKIQTIDNIESVRGYEGIIGKEYFSGLAKCFTQFTFSGREYNPPNDEINCLLSFCYSILYSEIAHKIQEHGLCIFLGFLHEMNNGQLSLVYDISEVLKQKIDLFVLSLVNNKQCKNEYFNKKEDGSCLLNTYGKAFVLREWMKILRGTKYYEKEEKYVSFSEEIRREVIKIKDYIAKEEDYDGYLIS